MQFVRKRKDDWGSPGGPRLRLSGDSPGPEGTLVHAVRCLSSVGFRHHGFMLVAEAVAVRFLLPAVPEMLGSPITCSVGSVQL